jgi:hypothetical protein
MTGVRLSLSSTSVFAMTATLPQVCVPAELSLVRLSLAAGLEAGMQAFLQPGIIPTGFTFKCREAERRHRVPLDGRDLAPLRQIGMKELVKFQRCEDVEVCRNLAQFLDSCGEVFSVAGQEEQDMTVVSLLHSRAGLPPPSLCWLPLPRLLSALHPQLTPAMAEVELQRDRFLYSPGLPCDWHQTRTDTVLCTQAVVR